MQEYLRRLLKDKARLRKWKRIMIALSCIVVVCTVYALSLPAQTMACDKEEHTHTAECYDENNELICEKEEHTHNEDCNKQEEVNEQEEVVKDEPETINNEQVSQESEEETTTTTTTETTTETTKQPFDLSSEANKDKITSVVMYYKDENGTWNNLEDGNASPSSTELYLKVEFDKINTKELLEQHNGILVYSLPDFMRDFEKAGNGNLLAGERNIGTIEIENNQVKVTLKKDYLNELVTNSSNQLDGSFYVKGQIDLTEINKSDGKATLTVGKKTVILDYGKECIEKFGSVTIDKQISNVDKKDNSLTYTVTVTAGKDGCKGLYVVDKFTSNSNLVSYLGNISSTETELNSTDNKQDPFETIEKSSSQSHGKIYKAKIPDSNTKIPTSGEPNITNPCIVWNIGNMEPNEIRTLTYYVKLKDKESLNGNTINNSASLYSKGSTDTYDKGVDTAEFTPKIDYDGLFTKTVDGNITRNADDGSYTIPFKSSISIKKDTSNYTIKNLQFYDYLKHDLNTEINADLLQYIHFDKSTFKLYKNNSVVDSAKYNIKWSTDNTEFKEWNDKDNFRSFVLSGNEDTPINLSPGESCYITYNVIVKPEVFAKLHTDSINAFNRFIAHADNVNKRNDFAGGFEAWNSISNIKTYEWNAKQVEKIATTTPKTETMSGDRFIYENNAIQKDSTSNTSFTIPEGSYKYTVETNKTLNDFNVNEVTMTDTLTSNHMKYVGYMKVEALEAESISSDLNKEKNDTYTLNSHYKTVDTKWVKIDDQNSFSLKPYDLGWTDKNYAYRFTYYAKPDNLDTFTETKVKNKFTLEGVVKKGNGTFKFNQEDVSRETTLTIKGNLNLNANKQSWYYKEPNTDSNTWTNGELYWVVDIGGTQINKDMVFRDLIKTGDGITNSILREGSLVGIYKGTLPEGKKISDYKDIEDLKNKSGLTPINDKFISQLNGTNELLLTAKDDIQLGNEKVYMIIKSEPSELPSPTNNRDTKTYKNSIYIKEDGEYVSEIPAEKTLYTSPKVLKELGQVFKYDGIVTTLKIGADKKDNGDADPSKIDTKLLNKSCGVFISWAFKVNYDGQLSGDYDVIDDIPDGMEFSYMRVKWHGDEDAASKVTSKTIDNPGSGWEFRENDSPNDNKKSEHTIYYVSKDKKRTMIRLGEFVSKSIRDNNSVDVQVVCRITDPQVLLGAQPSDFINKVTLQKDGKDIATSSSKVPVQLNGTDKNIDKKLAKENGQKLEFEINTNKLGQTLPTNDNGGLTLVDRLGENLKLDTTSVKVFNSNNEELTNCKKSYQNNILEIKIPNNIPIKITYTATVNAKPGDSVNIANTAYWKGYSEKGGGTVQQSYSYNVSGTIGASSVVNFKLTKQDENDMDKVLSGATFKIEKCTFDEYGKMTTSEISTPTTGNDGTIAQNLQYDTLYRITETQAPYGYVLDDKPIYILDVKDKDNYVNTVKQKIKDGELNILYKQENFDLDVMNHKGEITVVKKFINDAAGKSTKPVSGTYRFGLYDDKNTQLQPIKTITYSANDTPDKSVKFENLELDKTYYVYELDDKDQPITDTSKEVTINTMNYQVVYEKNGIALSSDKSSETIVVTNKSRTKILPSTGSMGTLIYRLLGATLVVASLICLSNINKNNRKEKRRKK